MSEESQTRGGVLDAARRLLKNFVTALNNRLQLISLEIREETARVLQILVLTVAGLFFASLSFIMIPIAILLFIPDQELGKLVFLGITIIYLGCATGFSIAAFRLIRYAPLPFSETVRQFQKDSEALGLKK